LEATSAFADASIGSNDTYDAALEGTIVHAPVAIEVFTERFSTDGYPVIAANQRGRVDNNASADSDLFSIRSDWQINRDNSLSVRARRFDDERGNGTLFTRNDTLGTDVSAVWSTKFPEESSELQLSAYGQHRKFRSTFSSVNATRDVETPALDQFNVPANSAGTSLVWSTLLGTNHRLTLGGDFRWVEGETDEAFRWDGVKFTRLRNAGGDQLFAGIFGEDTWSVSDKVTIVGGARFDEWELYDGFRRETDRASGKVLLDSQFPDRDGQSVNGRIGVRIKATENLSLRSAIYTGFRVPTLNELYRPFRVGNDVTEANAALKPERLLGGETGLEWQATSALRFSGTVFLNRMHDAVGNITIGTGPSTFNPGGFIPAGGVLRLRENVDLVTAPGFEGTVQWQLGSSLSLKGSYLLTRPRIARATDPGLEGKLLAQTPEHVLTGGVEWTPAAKWIFSAQVRYSDRQFEDDQNSRVLAPFTTFDAAAIYDISQRLSVALRVENLFNEQIETGKSADDIVSIGAPRLVTLQARWQL
jgi:outer membrane receptor protein involved in Fe transport